MFNFKAPNAMGYQEAVKQARLINGAHKELHTVGQGEMLEFADSAALEAAIDGEIADQRSAMAGRSGRLRIKGA